MDGELIADLSYVLAPSRFGPVVVLWQEAQQGPQVQRVFLSQAGHPTKKMFQVLQMIGHTHASPTMQGLGRRITRFLEGADVAFSLNLLALDTCSEFQQQVLRAEHAIPRGWVSTYGRIAEHLGVSGGARAVGNALANNPFPILIPCHRAIRSDGSLGGYQGGLEMKRELLRIEGVEVSPAGKVVTDKFCY